VLAGKSASFIQAFSKIGLIPDSGGTYTLPRLVGLNLASALMITGDKLSAEDAKGFGMVYKVYDDAELVEKTFEFATNIAAMPTQAIGFTKRLLNASATNNMEQQLKLEGDIQVQAASSYDYNEGVKSFLEKRKPEFKGE
jgi:2-(1,2-epoxy-1,2-dihydrophenyl)acetyl-CoA isomerase